MTDLRSSPLSPLLKYFSSAKSQDDPETAAGNMVPIFDLSPRQRHTKRRPMFPFAIILLLVIWYVYCFDTSDGGVRSTINGKAKAVLNQVTNQQRPQGINSFSGKQSLDLSHLKWHVRTQTFEYAHRVIKTKKVFGDRPNLTRVKDKLFSDSITLPTTDIGNITFETSDPLTLEVVNSPRIDTSILSFGIATKTPRVAESLAQFAHWLPGSGCSLHVHSEAHARDAEVQKAYVDAGINLQVHQTSLPFALSYFSLIKTLYENRSQNTKWLVLIDDDTFIPSLPYLVQHLTQHYDPTSETMVAAMSDKMDQIAAIGLIPFGGGGIFISVPLAEKLVQDHIWNDCMSNNLNQGDQVVNDCLNSHTSVRPVFDRGLNQMDIEGDASGYYESGRRMLTVHHWRSWYEVNVPAGAKVSEACGYEGVFQRWLFDENIVLSNGYSISEYPNGMSGQNGEPNVDLSGVEKTWAADAWHYEHFIGPLREPLNRDGKRQFKLVDAIVLEGLGVRQTYVDLRMEEEDFNDRVVELLWLF